MRRISGSNGAAAMPSAFADSEGPPSPTTDGEAAFVPGTLLPEDKEDSGSFFSSPKMIGMLVGIAAGVIALGMEAVNLCMDRSQNTPAQLERSRQSSPAISCACI